MAEPMKRDLDMLVAAVVVVLVYLAFIWLWEGLR